LDDIPPTHPRRLAGETVKVTVAGSVYEVDFATRTMRDNEGTVHPIKWNPPSSDLSAGGSESSRAQPLKVLGESTRQNVQPSASAARAAAKPAKPAGLAEAQPEVQVAEVDSLSETTASSAHRQDADAVVHEIVETRNQQLPAPRVHAAVGPCLLTLTVDAPLAGASYFVNVSAPSLGRRQRSHTLMASEADWARRSDGARELRVTVKELLPNLEYVAEVWARRYHLYSASTNLTVVPLDPAIPTPENFCIKQLENGPAACSIELSWDAHIEAESFVVRRRKWKVKKMSFLEVPARRVVSEGIASVVVDAEHGSQFMYSVAAVTANGDQSLWSEPVSITTPPTPGFRRLGGGNKIRWQR
jgi:hypothetical protein